MQKTLMRVLLIAGSYPPEQCGVGDYTCKLAEALAMQPQFYVGVLTTIKSERVATNKVNLIELDQSWRFSEIPKIISAIRKWSPDIIHIQYPSQGFLFRRMPSLLPIVCRLAGFKVIETWHEPHSLRGIFHFLMQVVGASGLIFVFQSYFQKLPKVLSILIARLPKKVIPIGSNLPTSSLNVKDRMNVRFRYLGGKERLVVFFGFVYPNKGIELIFDIANPTTDTLFIVGGIKDEIYAKELFKLAKIKGWEENVQFSGFISNEQAADILFAADAVVLPLLNGSRDNNGSILAALAQGTLVISTAVPPRGDEPERNLYTALPSNVNEMKSALNRHAGRRVTPISIETSWNEIATAHVAFYRQFN
jgi:glycosyltransferase involved in cell wall biosynthesis